MGVSIRRREIFETAYGAWATDNQGIASQLAADRVADKKAIDMYVVVIEEQIKQAAAKGTFFASVCIDRSIGRWNQTIGERILNLFHEFKPTTSSIPGAPEIRITFHWNQEN